jgi:hypothetical protein
MKFQSKHVKQPCASLTLKKQPCKNKSSFLVNDRHFCTVHARNIKASEACSICYEQMHKNNCIRLYDCDHFFHLDCLRKWSAGEATNGSCPLCRRSLMSVDYMELYKPTAYKILNRVSGLSGQKQAFFWRSIEFQSVYLLSRHRQETFEPVTTADDDDTDNYNYNDENELHQPATVNDENELHQPATVNDENELHQPATDNDENELHQPATDNDENELGQQATV